MKTVQVLVVGLVLAGLSMLVMAGGGTKHHGKGHHPKQKHVQMLLLLNGIKNTYACSVPITDLGSVEATCHDHDIIDLRSNKIIGTATDATTDMAQVDGAFVATGTTFFRLPYGELVVRGRGTIQPVAVEGPIMNGSPVTHIAGIFPQAGASNVLYGTGIYANASGTFALLGALDLSNAGQGQMAFNCVFFIDLELQ